MKKNKKIKKAKKIKKIKKAKKIKLLNFNQSSLENPKHKFTENRVKQPNNTAIYVCGIE